MGAWCAVGSEEMYRDEVTLPREGYVRQRDVLRVVPIAPSTLWRWIGEGRFPKPIKIGPACTAWRIEDVRAWIAARGASSDDGSTGAR